MPIQLTPGMMARAYDYLSCQAPFNKWKLPPSKEVKFQVSRHKDRYGHHQMIGGVVHIVFSSRFVGRHETLLATMAHEMAHFKDISHGKVFQRLADEVCRLHEFDRLTF